MTSSDTGGASSYVGQLDHASAGSEVNAPAFIVSQIAGRMATAALVRVLAVTNAGGVSAVGFVDVQPLVNQVDGAGNATPHGPLHNLPYIRLQGGADAIILDPKVGDLGLALFCSHDSSSAKARRAQVNPGSRRRHDMADGVYLGGCLNGTPQQVVAFTAQGIQVTSPSAVRVDAPSVTVNASQQVTIASPSIKLN